MAQGSLDQGSLAQGFAGSRACWLKGRWLKGSLVCLVPGSRVAGSRVRLFVWSLAQGSLAHRSKFVWLKVCLAQGSLAQGPLAQGFVGSKVCWLKGLLAQGSLAQGSLAQGSAMRWGLVPAFASRPEDYDVFAGLETMCSGVWRPLLGSRRCVVLLDGFYEWKAVGKAKVPMFIRNSDAFDGHCIPRSCGPASGTAVTGGAAPSASSSPLAEAILPVAGGSAEDGPRHAPLMMAGLFDSWCALFCMCFVRIYVDFSVQSSERNSAAFVFVCCRVLLTWDRQKANAKRIALEEEMRVKEILWLSH